MLNKIKNVVWVKLYCINFFVFFWYHITLYLKTRLELKKRFKNEQLLINK